MLKLIHGDCLQVLPTLESGSVDAVVTDPPYHLTSVSRNGSARVPGTGPFGRHRVGEKGFMGKTWDGGGIAFNPAVWLGCLHVLKPGAYLLAFGGTRTFHRMACAIEDAGFVIQDCVSWLYGSGFPKHRSKLKPAWEPIIVAWKPDRKATPLNIDGCRIGTQSTIRSQCDGPTWSGKFNGGERLNGSRAGRWPANVVLSHHPECVRRGALAVRSNGHYPATRGRGGNGTAGHVGQKGLTERHTNGETVTTWHCHPDCPVRLLDEQAGPQKSGGTPFNRRVPRKTLNCYGEFNGQENPNGIGPSAGKVSRFFYTAKASRRERGEGNTHPTVKPLALMRWLCRLVTPPGGTVLDPFMGSGTTGMACRAEGFGFIGVEQEPEYLQIAKRRIRAARRQLAEAI